MFDFSDKVCLMVLASKLDEEKYNKDDVLLKMHRVATNLVFSACNDALECMVNRDYISIKDRYYTITDKGRDALSKILNNNWN